MARVFLASLLCMILLALCLLTELGTSTAAAGSTVQAAAVPPAPLERQPAPASMQVALQGSGLLITYYSGVVEALQQHSSITPGATQVSGLSGGAWTAALTALGLPGTAQRDVWKRWVAECVERWGSCAGHIRQIGGEAFEELLPDDVAERVGGRVRVALAQLDARQAHLNGSAPWLVASFLDKEDLKAALQATSYTPRFSGPQPYTLFRGQPVLDGGYAAGFEQLCPEGGCLTAASWYVGDRANRTCDPDRCGAFASMQRCSPLQRLELIPDQLFQNEAPPEQWALPQSLEQACEAAAGTEDTAGAQACQGVPLYLPSTVPHAQNNVQPDISPGKYGPLPAFEGRELLACEWQTWSMKLPPGREMLAMDLAFQQGQADAAAWAVAHGYGPPAVPAAAVSGGGPSGDGEL